MSRQEPWVDLRPGEVEHTIDVPDVEITFSPDELRRDPKFEECLRKYREKPELHFPDIDEQLEEVRIRIEELTKEEEGSISVDEALAREVDELEKQLCDATEEKGRLEQSLQKLREECDSLNWELKTLEAGIAEGKHTSGGNPLGQVGKDFDLLIGHVLFEVRKANEIRKSLGMEPFKTMSADGCSPCRDMADVEALRSVLSQISRFYASAVPPKGK